MSDYAAFLHREEEDQARFEQLVTEGEGRVTEQMLRIERLRADGHDTKQAERFLAELRQNLDEWHRIRADVTRIMQTYGLMERANLSPHDGPGPLSPRKPGDSIFDKMPRGTGVKSPAPFNLGDRRISGAV